jgi:nucleoside 2-deoxyribosyltransferase
MAKFYLAARYARRDELREHRTILQAAGIESTSNWLEETSPLDGNLTNEREEFYVHTANVDIADIDRADALILFSEDPLVGFVRGGRHVEFGYAHAKQKPIYVIGPKENVFHYRERVYHYDTIEAFVKAYNAHDIVH